MSSPQEKYLEAMNAAADSWAKAAQQFFTATPQSAFPVPTVNPAEVIDQVFDFAEQFLSAQRQFAKSLATAGTNMADTMRNQAESFTHTVQDATSKTLAAATSAIDESVAVTQDVVTTSTEQAVKAVETTTTSAKDAAVEVTEATASAGSQAAEAAKAPAPTKKATKRAPAKTAAKKTAPKN